MNKKFIIILIIGFCILSINTSFSAPADPVVDDTFNYQGELFDGINPASGAHDFKIEAWSLPGAGDGIKIGQTATFLGVLVFNGIFTLENIDLGDITDGFNIYFEIQVRKNNIGAAYEVLTRQKLKSVPYATTLTSGSAVLDQVLTYDGSEWVPQDPVVMTTPWLQNVNDISFVGGKVGIGTALPSANLTVKSATSLTAKFDGGNSMFVGFSEDDTNVGYLGSFTTVAGTNDNDFEIGTYSSNNDGGIQLSIQNTPKMTILNSGDVGVNTTSPTAALHVAGVGGGKMFKVTKDGDSKLTVDSNGGLSVGNNTLPSSNGLFLEGDAKQPIASNGLMKYMVSVENCGDAGVSITNSYNGVTFGGSFTPTNDAGGIGSCEITFPGDVSSRFIQATAIGDVGDIGNSVICRRIGTNTIGCIVSDSSGSETPGDVDVLIH